MSGNAAQLRDETTEGAIAEMIEEIRRMGSAVTPRRLELHTKCAAAFARQNGWKVARAPFAPEQLARGSWQRKRGENSHAHYPVLDHAEFFSMGRRPIAITSHSYARDDQIERCIAEHGLRLRWLAVSWYWPAGARAFVVTRP